MAFLSLGPWEDVCGQLHGRAGAHQGSGRCCLRGRSSPVEEWVLPPGLETTGGLVKTMQSGKCL